MKYFKYLFLISIFVSAHVHGQINIKTTDLATARIVYDDVDNFIQALNILQSNSDTIAVIQEQYIDKGTAGLKIFIEKYGLTAEKLSRAIHKYPADYHAIAKKLRWLKTQEDSVRQYFKKFKHFIPDAVFPPTYYLVDTRRGIGSGSIEGQLITIEKEARRIVDPGLKTHIIHELVHLNQLQAIGSLDKYLAIYNREKSLLAITIREGIAEFFAELVTGKYTQDEAYFYTRYHEKKLWTRFSREMYGIETGDWMWSAPENPDQPRDVAYVLGAMIVEYYYKTSPDVNLAVSELLSITDYAGFMKKCKYSDKFNQK